MQLFQFKELVANMPVSYQAFPSKRSTWASHLEGGDAAAEALNRIFGSERGVVLSRDDLRGLAAKPDLAQFVMATIIWGYPGGMRGNHVRNLIRHLKSLTQLLAEARTTPIAEWMNHYEKVGPIEGIGLSTYT